MREVYKPQAVMSTSATEIARWLARIERVDFAVNENTGVLVGGMADDGQELDIVAKKAKEGEEDWQNSLSFERAILYELKSGINYERVMRAASREEKPDPLKDPRPVVAAGHLALEKGLKRIGLLAGLEMAGGKSQRLAPPIGAVAALSFERADIEQPLDRRLFDKAVEIRAAKQLIASQTPPRFIEYEIVPIGSAEPIQTKTSIFRLVSHKTNPGVLEKLELDPNGELSPWWQELQKDLERIDAAKAEL